MEGDMRFTSVLAGLNLAVAFTISAGAATAQTAAEQAACRGDFSKLCAGTRPGGGRVLACLGKQKDKLSPACLKVVEAHGG
jgi:hypothetical protein